VSMHWGLQNVSYDNVTLIINKRSANIRAASSSISPPTP
jgi:hypothetical protein